MARRREVEVFSLSFLDAICCGFGAVIMLLVLNKAGEPRIIEQAKTERRELIAALQEELVRIRGETDILNRDRLTVEEQLSQNRDALARLQGDLSRIRGQFAASKQQGVDTDAEGDLLAARQRLTDEMRALLANYRPPADDTTVGGIPVDSQYIIFVIDTSGSMFQGPWRLVLRKVSETLQVHPRVKGIQVLNDEGKYMFPSYAGKWIPDSPNTRRRIINTLSNWSPYSDSSPVEGIAEAISTFYEPGKSVAIFVFGDDFPTGQVEAVSRYVERINKADELGNRLVRIHGVGFPTQLAGGRIGNALRFANLMRTLCERNGGTFVALTTLN
ncbi:MAG: VWA domain-containing protein [Gammaproteobacteria bacterium]|nr:MAG: VWA domain-containing protein [Gammaproteobacteria bacterium]